MPSFILIHPTVWPQYTNVTVRQTGQDRQTDRQTDRQDNGPIANGRPTISLDIKILIDLTCLR